MSLASRLIYGLAQPGFSRQAAAIASLARCEQSFSVDEHGHWLDRCRQATFVSPSFHTPFDVMDAQFLDGITAFSTINRLRGFSIHWKLAFMIVVEEIQRIRARSRQQVTWAL